MFKIFLHTGIITFIRFLLNVSPAVVFAVGALFLRSTFIRWDMHVITHLMAVPIALGLGTAYRMTIVRFIDYLLRLAHTIAATVVVLDQPYRGTLTGYAWKEATRNLIGNTATSVITVRGVKVVKTIKTALLQKTICNHLYDPGGFGPGHSLFKFLIYNINMALDSMDEVLVSYTWLTQELFRRHWEIENPKKKISIKTRVKNQAKYFLEGAALYVRVLPKILVNNTLYLVAIETLIILTTIVTSVLVLFSFGLGWLNILIVFLSTRLVLLAVTQIIVPTLRVDVAIYQFYNQVSKLETTSPEFIKDLVGKLPPLAWVAKQTGDPEYKDNQVTLKDVDCLDNCAADIIPWAECESALRDFVNDTAKVFQVHEKNVLEPVGGAEENVMYEETPLDTEEEALTSANVEEESPIPEPTTTIHSTTEDNRDLFNLEMPSDFDIPSSIIKKVDFGDRMSDPLDIDDLI
jgi:hypothetical protein